MYTVSKYENLQNHCFQYDYPELIQPGESDYEHLGGMDHSYDLFQDQLKGEDLKEFNDSFQDGYEGWIITFEKDGEYHHVWGDGIVSQIIVITETIQ